MCRPTNSAVVHRYSSERLQSLSHQPFRVTVNAAQDLENDGPNVIERSNYIITARCYTERGIATASRLSVRPSVSLRYRDHIGWNSSKIISRLVNLGCLLSADFNITD